MLYDSSDYLSKAETREIHARAKASGWVKFYGNSFILKNGTIIGLMSYDTPICDLYTDDNYIYFNYRAFEYSSSTSRHISKFLEKFTGGKLGFYECKNFIQNADIGEVRLSENGYYIVCL